MKDKPLVSIVTPTYNYGRFIEDTILSVKNQDYPNIEHIIVDGGSTDNTLEILKKYESTYNMRWISEPDEGESDAINKGFKMAKGEILAWLDSDDVYSNKKVISRVVEVFINNPDVQVVHGNCAIIDEKGNIIKKVRTVPFNYKAYLYGYPLTLALPQPSTFWRREIFFKVGMLDPKLYWAMDRDLFLRFAEYGAKFKFIKDELSYFRLHPKSKSVSNPKLDEWRNIRDKRLRDMDTKSFKFRLIVAWYILRRISLHIVQGDLKFLFESFLELSKRKILLNEGEI